MLKQIRNSVALITLLALGACNSVTAPLGQAEDQEDQGRNRHGDPQVINVGDEVTPGDHGGGGGSGPGERDNDPLVRPDGKRDPQEWTPDGMGSGGPGSSAGSQAGEQSASDNSSGEGGEWTPDP